MKVKGKKMKKLKSKYCFKKIFKAGNSKGIIIPLCFLNYLEIDKETVLKLQIDGDKIIIQKKEKE